MTSHHIQFIGDASHHEFREPVAWMREYCNLTVADSVESANSQFDDARSSPDVIVVAASRPGIYSQQDIASLLCRAPLARIVGLMGGWCEGEMRTGQPWKGVTRVYWHEFVPRLAEELTGAHRRGRLSMPRTFTESELSGIAVPLPALTQRGLVVIRVISRTSYEAIAEACCAIGHSTTWAHPGQPVFVSGAAAAIWDVEHSIEVDAPHLVAFAKQVGNAPLITLIGFPRSSDRQLASECGASTVISKPYLLEELWTELTRVTAECRTSDDQISAA